MNEHAARGSLIEIDFELSFDELQRSSACSAEWLLELVQLGAIDPHGSAPADWRFAAEALRRARVAARLARDLQLNAAGAALVLDLLDEIATLRQLRQR
jgi:chaperone modulatory protein CbpM